MRPIGINLVKDLEVFLICRSASRRYKIVFATDRIATH